MGSMGQGDNEGTKNVDKKTVIRLHLWFETLDGVVFGMGRAQLLDHIEECGSLKKAAEKMEMSYRAAWGKIKKTEDILGFKLIKKISNKEGYNLTEEGKKFKDTFLLWLDDVESFALKRAQELFPWQCDNYDGVARGKDDF